MTRATLVVIGAIVSIACGGLVERDRLGTGGKSGGGGGGGGGGKAGGGTSSGGVGNTGGTIPPIGGSGGGGSGGTPCVDVDKNPHHCGKCDHGCVGGECVDGVCQPFVIKYLGNEGATALAIDQTHVFWASPLQRSEKNANGWITLAPAGYDVWGVAVDEQHVYFTDIYDGLKRMNKDGTGEVTSLGAGGYRVALDADYVYAGWQGVWKIAKQDPSKTIFLAPVGGQGIALDDTHVYFTTWSPGGAWRVSKSGEDLVKLASADYSSYVAVYGDMVYWSLQGYPGGVYAVPKNGSAPAELIAKASTPYGIAADALGVYWTEFDLGNIWMLPMGSTTPILLASGQHGPRDLAIDEQSVFWTNDASFSAVSRVAKPNLP